MNAKSISSHSTPADTRSDHPGTLAPGEVFRESQPLYQNLIARFTVVFVGLSLAATAIPGLLGGPIPSLEIWIVVIAMIELTLIGILFIRLKTVVTHDTLILKYFPFPGRRVPIGSIEKAEAIEYNPLANGGWGWRISRRFHRVFNVSGNKGVYVRFGPKPSDRFLVGSRDHTALAAAIESVRKGD